MAVGLTLLAIIIETWVQNLSVRKYFDSVIYDFHNHDLYIIIFACTDNIIKLFCALFLF